MMFSRGLSSLAVRRKKKWSERYHIVSKLADRPHIKVYLVEDKTEQQERLRTSVGDDVHQYVLKVFKKAVDESYDTEVAEQLIMVRCAP